MNNMRKILPKRLYILYEKYSAKQSKPINKRTLLNEKILLSLMQK